MTLDEKFMQLSAIYKDPIIDDCKGDGTFNPARAGKVMAQGMGRISTIFRTFDVQIGSGGRQ